MAKNVLIVDDSSFMRQILKNIITKIGYEIYEASEGKQAIEEYKKQKPDLVLLDIILPGITGKEILAEIKKINSKQKVIMVTAVGQQQIIDECKKLGAEEYIIKPFDDKEVVARVKKVMKE